MFATNIWMGETFVKVIYFWGQPLLRASTSSVEDFQDKKSDSGS